MEIGWIVQKNCLELAKMKSVSELASKAGFVVTPPAPRSTDPAPAPSPAASSAGKKPKGSAPSAEKAPQSGMGSMGKSSQGGAGSVGFTITGLEHFSHSKGGVEGSHERDPTP